MIVDDLYKGEHKPWAPLSRGTFRMSGAEQCERRAGYSYLGYPEDLKGDEDFRAVVLEEGNAHEAAIVRRLQMAGFEIWNFGTGQTWTVFKHRNQFWRGHPDLFMRFEDRVYGIEIKSTVDQLFQKYADASEEVAPGCFVLHDQRVLLDTTYPYYGQVQLYLHSEKAVEMGIEQWIVLVKNRNNGAMLECVVDKDWDYVEELVNRWQSFWPLMSAQRLPDRPHEKSSQVCKNCPFRQTCWAALGGLPDNGELDLSEDEELVERARLWREGKDFSKRAELRLEFGRLGFENAAITNKANRLLVDGLSVRISDRERNGLDSDLARSLLRRMVQEGHLTQDEYDDCQTKTAYTQVDVRDTKTKGE